jgi:hypothetical protein
MARARDIAGLVAGVLILLSSAAHTLLGWRQLSGELAAAHVEGELLRGLQFGWYFGGVAMLLLAVILLALFAGRLRGEGRWLLPAATVGAGYLAQDILSRD